jgi:hypothetical protein
VNACDLLSVFCYLDVYLKVYLRLKFLGFHKLFLHKVYVLVRFSCIICMDVVSHLIFLDLYNFLCFVWSI